MKVVLLAIFLLIGYASSQDQNDAFCKLCLPNGVNCISRREFKICRGQESPADGKVFTCSETQVCTDQGEVCLEAETTNENGELVKTDPKCTKENNPTEPIAEEKLGDCAVCVKDYAFTCIGPKKYALCMGKVGKGKFDPAVTEDCPENYVCNTATKRGFLEATDYNQYYPCVPSCAIDAQPSCAKDYEPPRTLGDVQETCKQALQDSKNQPIFKSLSTDCTDYVYCEHKDENGEATITSLKFACKEGKYFENKAQKCLEIPEGGVPAECVA